LKSVTADEIGLSRSNIWREAELFNVHKVKTRAVRGKFQGQLLGLNLCGFTQA